ncbi:MAG: 4'-phosphopantetheinyl transferase superfamily protein [Gemmatimonadaceae bacterium]
MAASSGAVAELWYARVGEHEAQLDLYSRDYLSEDEQRRQRRYRGRGAAERYVVTRSLVRGVLSERLGVPPREVPVNRTDTGKPVISGGVHFNVSHSGDLILLALSVERAIGVDVERRRDIARVEALVRRWLSETERTAVVRLGAMGASPSDAFLRVWSLKEARLKALGVGIAGQSGADELLAGVEVSPLDDLLASIATDGDDQGYVGAVAFA